MENFGLYVILTQPRLPHAKIAEICVKAGVKMLQLREKHLSDQALLSLGKEIKRITKGSSTKFIINDRVDLAFLMDADGVHLGQDDLCIADARKIVGSDIIIGRSTHSIEQANAAIAEGADYIGFGPVYETPTKAVPDPTVGLALLKKAIHTSPVPVVAIGGIFPKTLDSVISTGAQNFAVVRYLMETDEVESRILQLLFSIKNKKLGR